MDLHFVSAAGGVTDEKRVRAQFEAMLLEPLLKPLESAFGEYGDVAGQGFATALGRALEQRND